jgi:hypothetical protein
VLGRLGDVPVFENLYSDTGLLLGWLTFTNGTVQANMPLAWIKPVSHSGLYPSGFTNLLIVVASGWTNPPPKDVLSDGTLMISDIDLAFTVSISNNEVIKESGTPTNSLAGAINPKTGLMTITFGNGDGKATTKGYGAVLQDSTNAGGYYLTKTNAGGIWVTN